MAFDLDDETGTRKFLHANANLNISERESRLYNNIIFVFSQSGVITGAF